MDYRMLVYLHTVIFVLVLATEDPLVIVDQEQVLRVPQPSISIREAVATTAFYQVLASDKLSCLST